MLCQDDGRPSHVETDLSLMSGKSFAGLTQNELMQVKALLAYWTDQWDH